MNELEEDNPSQDSRQCDKDLQALLGDQIQVSINTLPHDCNSVPPKAIEQN